MLGLQMGEFCWIKTYLFELKYLNCFKFSSQLWPLIHVQKCILQMLSRQKPAIGPGSATPAKDKQKKKQLPKVEEFLENRDYTGAITLLEVK